MGYCYYLSFIFSPRKPYANLVCRELYLWASTIITSRAFSSKVLSGAVQPDDLPEDGVSALLPLIDLPNHRPMAKVEWRAGDKDIGLLVLEDHSAGQEISNNYGPRNNEQCMYRIFHGGGIHAS